MGQWGTRALEHSAGLVAGFLLAATFVKTRPPSSGSRSPSAREEGRYSLLYELG